MSNIEKLKRQLLMLEPITSAITLDIDISELFISIMAPITQEIDAEINILLLKQSSNYIITEYYFENEIEDLRGKYLQIPDNEVNAINDAYIVNQFNEDSINSINTIYEFFSKSLNIIINSIMILKLKEYGYIIILNKRTGEFDDSCKIFCTIISNIISAILLIQDQVKFILEKKIELKEIQLASEIHEQLLPKTIPEIKGIELYGYSKPAKSIGGDYYDFFQFDNNRIGVIIADVAGCGLPAALVMIMISSIAKTIIRSDLSPATILSFLNKKMNWNIGGEKFVTLSYYLLDISQNTLYYSNAGHLPLIIYKKNEDKIYNLEATGRPLGILQDEEYKLIKMPFYPGDIAVSYTDGIIEATNSDGEQFDIERTVQVVKMNEAKSAFEIVKSIEKELYNFTGLSSQKDDETLVILKMVDRRKKNN
ncbi:MAG: PP2C family protein-serine/threonine phosphatase [Spirochaetota bacterium]|nr:PP2C family protein-serine/threonine phosphatase [Spirochaetota bacterium]